MQDGVQRGGRRLQTRALLVSCVLSELPSCITDTLVDLLGSPSRTTDIQPPSTRQSAMSQNPLTISPTHTSLLVSAPNTSSLFVEDSFSEGGGGRRPGERMEYHRPFVTQGRSVDGGVRLKGGPPGHNLNIDNPPSEVGFNHADSLLPPLYQMHPSE